MQFCTVVCLTVLSTLCAFTLVIATDPPPLTDTLPITGPDDADSLTAAGSFSSEDDESDVDGESDDILDQLNRFWVQGSQMAVANLSDHVRSEDSVQVLRRWHGLTDILISSMMKRAFSSVANLMLELGVSSPCQNSMLRLMQGLKKQRTWALKCKAISVFISNFVPHPHLSLPRSDLDPPCQCSIRTDAFKPDSSRAL
jgi:hypothetical protein